MNEQIVNALLDAQSANARQDRALFNPSPEVDSALEHAVALKRTATPAQLVHVNALIGHLKDVRSLNALERESERQAAGLVDPITSVHEFVKTVRPLLADLMHPFVSVSKSADRLRELHAVFARTRPGTRTSVSVRHLLGVKKFTRLVEEHEAWVETVQVAL